MSENIDLIGVGSPVVDMLTNVEEEFVANLEGGKGGMELVDSEALESLVSQFKKNLAIAPGGSAGNTTYATAKLGSKVSFLGKLGNCESGQFYRNRFSTLGSDTSRFKMGEISNGRCLSMVTPDSERTMRTDLGAAMTLSPDEVSVEDFEGIKHAHLEGYLAFNRDLMEKVLKSAKEAGCSISFDLASFEVVNACKDVLEGWLTEYIDVVFANEDEASAFFPKLGDDYEAMAIEFSKLCDVAAVKLGKEGSLIASDGEVVFVEPVVVEDAMDTTGAGDYWAGGFLHAWLEGRELEECGNYGSRLGAEVVQVMGATLAEERWDEIITDLQS